MPHYFCVDHLGNGDEMGPVGIGINGFFEEFQFLGGVFKPSLCLKGNANDLGADLRGIIFLCLLFKIGMGQEADQALGVISHLGQESPGIGIGPAFLFLANLGDFVPMEFVGIKDFREFRDQVSPFVGQDSRHGVFLLMVLFQKVHTEINGILLIGAGDHPLGRDDPALFS